MEKTKTMFHNKYFQGILQLRDHDKELVEYIQNIIDKEGRNDIYLSRIIKVRGGTDLYLTSNKFLRKLGKRLLREIEGELKESEKLFTRDKQTGKNIYRLNVLFRPSRIKKGTIVTFKGKKVKVTSIGARVQLKEEGTGKRSFCTLKELQQSKE
jgi:NMD protein affecting ribosome stability and mRNA decay